MNFCADVMGDQPDDALAIGGRQSFTGVGKALREPVDPEPPIGVEHHLDDRGIFQKGGDRRPESRAQHARTAKDRFRFLVSCRHVVPFSCGSAESGPGSGMSRRGRNHGLTTTSMWPSYCGVQRQGNGGRTEYLHAEISDYSASRAGMSSAISCLSFGPCASRRPKAVTKAS